jgi:hypothetical protein
VIKHLVVATNDERLAALAVGFAAGALIDRNKRGKIARVEE